LEFSSPSRRIFIGSHSLPPLSGSPYRSFTAAPWVPPRWSRHSTHPHCRATPPVPSLGSRRVVCAARFLSPIESSPEPSPLQPPPSAAGAPPRWPSPGPSRARNRTLGEWGSFSRSPGRGRGRARRIPASRAGHHPKGYMRGYETFRGLNRKVRAWLWTCRKSQGPWWKAVTSIVYVIFWIL
jgi:hypothetical protein